MSKLEPIRWSDAMLTGVDEIDRQHRVLVNTLNEIIVCLPDQDDDELAERITRDLLGYALYHFETEQGLMLRSGYLRECALDAASHLAQHRAFSERVESLRNGINRGLELDLEGLTRFLHDWLIGHIMNSDVRFGRFLRGETVELKA
ncbi:MAG: hemerythrin family protein [Rhodocyclaceae bacterium]|nr:hemerythrin family protein [Rhodocyclaceae bacterium]